MSAEELRLTLQIKEVEVRQRELEVEAMLLKVKALELEQGAASTTSHIPSQTPTPHDSFEGSRHIALVPPFREAEVDAYFSALARIAATRKWPKNVWPLLLQCKLVGKPQEVCASLSIEDSLDYDTVKTTVLCAYELVPEAYSQKFRKCRVCKGERCFDKWCQASKFTTFENLRELMLMEEFKNQLPEKIAVYLNEQKVSSLTAAAVLAEFALTHNSVLALFLMPCCHRMVRLSLLDLVVVTSR